MCNSYRSKSNEPHNNDDIMSQNMRPVIEDVIGFGSCAEQDSTSQDSATDSGLYPDSEGMSPIPHSDEDKSDRIKLVNTNGFNRLGPDPSSDSVFLASAQNSLGNTQNTGDANEFNKYSGLHTEVYNFDDDKHILNSSCNILNDNLKEHLAPTNGEGQSNHSLLKELLENESEDDFGNFEYACVVPEALTQPTLLQDLNVNTNLIVEEVEDSVCGNIYVDSFCDLSNSNFEVCKMDGEQSAEDIISREEGRLGDETSQQDINNLKKDKLEHNEGTEDMQVHRDSISNRVIDREAICNEHEECNIKEGGPDYFKDESKRSENISIEPKQETEENDQESMDKLQPNSVESQDDFKNISETDQILKFTEESNVLSQEVFNCVISNGNNNDSIEATGIIDIVGTNKQIEGNDGDSCLYKEQGTGSDVIKEFETDDNMFKVQDSYTAESDYQYEKRVSESAALSEDIVHVDNLNEDEFDEFQFSSVHDVDLSLSRCNTEISSIQKNGKLWTASEQDESQTYQQEINSDHNDEVVPAVIDGGDFQSDEEFSNFADFSASVFSNENNDFLQKNIISQSEHHIEDNMQVCL